MFSLLLSTLAQMSLKKNYSGDGLPMMNMLMEAMFNTCHSIQQQLEGTQARVEYVLWITNAFASPDVNAEVVEQWKQYSGYMKVRSLIQKLDNLWNEDNRRKSLTKQQAWDSMKGKFL